MKMSLATKLVIIGLSLACAALLSAQALAQEAIIVTYKQDLFEVNRKGKNLPLPSEAGVEAACIATVLARNLQLASEDTKQKVAMFPALAGVKLANEALLLESEVGAEACPDPDEDRSGYFSEDFGIYVPDDYTLLIDLVRQFLEKGDDAANGRMVVCNLCWNARDYVPDDLFEGAEIGSPTTIGPLFIKALKVVDF